MAEPLALIVGAGDGLSASLARLLHDEGYRIALAARNVAKLSALAAEHAAGDWTIGVEEEDVHTALENRLTERAPDAGPHLHLGRSRNDQVLAALRLYLKDVCRSLAEKSTRAADELDALALREKHTPLPGYTHLQPAMPSSVPLWAGGFAAELRDDATGLAGAARRADRNPLGSAAGYGAPALPLDRERTLPPSQGCPTKPLPPPRAAPGCNG